MTHDPLTQTQQLTKDMVRALELYVLEHGPLQLTSNGYEFKAEGRTRLRLKTADELRAEGRRDMLDKCIASIEGLDKYHHGQINASEALTRLQALQEKP